MGGEKVLRAARTANTDPAALGLAQKELGVHHSTESEEVQLSLRAIESALTDDSTGVGIAESVFQAAQVALDSIALFPQEGTATNVQEVLVKAKEICGKTSALVTQIRSVAHETKAQDLKDILGTAAKLLNDRAIRIKIISIVKLASGHGNDEVAMAVSGLAQEINNIVNSLKGALLRLKLDTAVKQVTAMKSALGVLKTHGRNNF